MQNDDQLNKEKADKVRKALQDVLGENVQSVTVEYKQKLRPAGSAGLARDGEWSGNIYKYSF